MMTRSPLFIKGVTFLIYWKMTAQDKKKKNKVNELMVKSFSMSKAEAYRNFKVQVLCVVETPD